MTVDVTHQFCVICREALQPDDAFCTNCGKRRSVVLVERKPPMPPASRRTDSESTWARLFEIVENEPTGLIGAFMVFVAADIVCVIGSFDWFSWSLFVIPARLIGLLVNPGECSTLSMGTLAMYACSAKVAALTLASPIAAFALLLAMRKWIARRALNVTRLLPVQSQFMVAPLAATIAFAFGWFPVHDQINDDSGLLSQRAFPALVACFTYASNRYGHLVQNALAGTTFFERRDKLPRVGLWLLAALIPLGLSLIVTFQDRVSQAALKEQIVTIIALCIGYLAFTPRHGTLLGAVERTRFRRTTKAGLP